MRVLAVLAVVGGALWLSPVVEAAPASSAGAFVLTATTPGGAYAPTFTGNGMLGVRVPPSGQGYAAGTVPAQSERPASTRGRRGARSRATTCSSGPTSRLGRR